MRDLMEWESNLGDEFKQVLQLARTQFNTEFYFNSLKSYINLLALLPANDRRCIQQELVECLEHCLEISTTNCFQLGVSGKLYEDFPENFQICLFYARSLFVEGQTLKSIQIYEKSFELCEDILNRKIRLKIEMDNVRSHLFDQWHFPMLNDEVRNGQFGLAIKKCINDLRGKLEAIHAVDLGCGTGILATMMAREIEKSHFPSTFVSAIDSNLVMIHVAEQVFEKNNVAVQAHGMHSKEFQSQQPINLIVSETLDCALFGEKFVSSLLDLHQRLASTSNFQVLPSKASFYLALCESDFVEKQHFCEKLSKSNEKYVVLSKECYLNWPINMDDGLNDPYDSLQMSDLKDKHRLLSDPIEVLTVDFNDFEYLKETILTNKVQKQVRLIVNEVGKASCVVGWFRLQLYDDVFIDTNPNHKMCWPQTIFPFYPPVQLNPDSYLDFEICINDEKLYVCPTNLPKINCKKIRVNKPINLQFLNSHPIKQFYYDSLRNLESKKLIDFTDLVIDGFEEGFEVEYLSFIHEYVLKLDYLNVGKTDLKFNNITTLLHWPFNQYGCFDVERIELHKLIFENTNCQSKIFPLKFQLKGILVESSELKNRAGLVERKEWKKVYNQVDISPMQHYYIRSFHELDLKILEFEAMTKEVVLFEMEFENLLKAKNSGSSLYQNVKTIKIEKQTENCHAILYWFELITNNDGPKFSFKQLNSCINAFIFEPKLNFNGKTSINLKTFMFNHQFYFEIMSP